jgi:uncharacterized protein
LCERHPAAGPGRADLDTSSASGLDARVSTRTTPWPTGTPCWVDLAVSDIQAGAAFYTAVLGWDVRPTGPEFGEYVIGHVDGRPAGGLGPHEDPGEPGWTLYFASDDVDATAEAVASNGGSLVLSPHDVGPHGRMAAAADPTGAVFGVWQAGEHLGCGVVNEPGALTWEDLRSPDPDGARSFYTAVFGFSHQPVAGGPADYRTFAFPDQEDHPLGGIGGLEVPGQRPRWLVTFGVVDAAAAADAAHREGGAVTVPLLDTPFGRMAGLADATGALFWVVENAG